MKVILRIEVSAIPINLIYLNYNQIIDILIINCVHTRRCFFQASRKNFLQDFEIKSIWELERTDTIGNWNLAPPTLMPYLQYELTKIIFILSYKRTIIIIKFLKTFIFL